MRHRALAAATCLVAAACGASAQPASSPPDRSPEGACRNIVALAQAHRPPITKYTDARGMDDCVDELRRLHERAPREYECSLDCALAARTFDEGAACVEGCRRGAR